MPSYRSSRLATLTLTLLTLFSIIEARPSQVSAALKDPRHDGLSGYNVPIYDGITSLPSPTGTLKAITVGRGTQNYTCTSPTDSSTTAIPTPVAIGAKADLLDASPLLRLLPPAEGIKILDLLPSYLVNFDTSLLAAYSIPLLGHHYFNSDGQPTFDLGDTGFLIAKKTGSISAPAGACPGSLGKGFGAVDWLSLVDAGGSRGLGSVYRVVTAGGKAPPTCQGISGDIEVQYSALYWFFE
ncbi:hypothetical protein ACLMJK_000522 [Lecanora helva]